MDEIIKIRAHHLQNAIYSDMGALREDLSWNPVSKVLVGLRIGKFLRGRYGEKYGKDVADEGHRVMKALCSDKNNRFEFVPGLDSVCQACPLRTEECLLEGSADVGAKNKFGFEYGRIYSSNEVLELMRTYSEKKGLDFPSNDEIREHAQLPWKLREIFG
ncbi:MAG: hypothetical protein CL811_01195 [Colwelliaceae bacterium]|nr:hypothetical protein [Colwelliaceae bacterium]|tara:strand:+ start:919 stop:1398 length:480 start_codon:yes stop_codon:yes gene_type:complete